MTELNPTTRFIVLEGIDGCGKTTAIETLERRLRKMKAEGLIPGYLITREPGGTPYAEDIRELILSYNQQETFTGEAQTYLMLAARQQNYQNNIKEALAKGWVVICSRWHMSTIAQQAAGGGDWDWVKSVVDTSGLPHPDRYYLLDLTPEIARERMSDRELDFFETKGEDFHQAIYDGFMKLADSSYKDFVVKIDASAGLADFQRNLETQLGDDLWVDSFL